MSDLRRFPGRVHDQHCVAGCARHRLPDEDAAREEVAGLADRVRVGVAGAWDND